MVKAVLCKDKTGCLLCVEGHATGSPAVCAAVSAIVYSLAGYLVNARSALVRKLSLNDGEAVIDADGGSDVRAAFEMAGIGLAQLADAYPEYIMAETLDGKKCMVCYNADNGIGYPEEKIRADTGKVPAEEETHA